MAHRFTKPLPPWTPSRVGDDGDLETAQQHADAEAGVWHALWGAGSRPAALTWDNLPGCAEVACPDARAIHETCMSFSKFTAVGSDEFHPRHLGTLSDDCLQGLAVLLAAMVRLSCLPHALQLLLIVLVPKPDQADWPISYCVASLVAMGQATVCGGLGAQPQACILVRGEGPFL